MAGSVSQSSRPFVPHQATTGQKLAGWLVYAITRVLYATLRCRWENRSGLLDQPGGERVIFCVWHNRLALALIMYQRFVQRRQPDRQLAALVSASRDGAFLAHILELFGVQPVRGSSSRRGPQALREMTHWAERGLDVAITPDGPRGPACVAQEGVVSLAQLTGLPIVPASYQLSWKWSLPSWDRFQVPLPFARCTIKVGTPIRIPADATDEEREKLRLELQAALNALAND